MKRKERLGCGKHQFPNRDRRTASPLASPLQPMDHVFYGDLFHQKVVGRSSPAPIITPAVSMATGGKTEPREFFNNQPVAPQRPTHTLDWLISSPVRGVKA